MREKDDSAPLQQDADDLDYYDSFDDDDEEFDCHMGRDGSCGLAGSEECDWECPVQRTRLRGKAVQP